MDVNQLITAMTTNGIGFVCAAAVLWFAWFRETKTIPALISSFTACQDRAQSSFEIRNGKVVDTFAALCREERAIYQKWHEEDRGVLEKLTEETRDNRHMVRDLAHQLGLRQAIEKERTRQATGTGTALTQESRP